MSWRAARGRQFLVGDVETWAPGSRSLGSRLRPRRCATFNLAERTRSSVVGALILAFRGDVGGLDAIRVAPESFREIALARGAHLVDASWAILLWILGIRGIAVLAKPAVGPGSRTVAN